MKFFAQIQNGKLIPEYNNDYEQMSKLRSGVTYSVEIKQPRNVQFHRKAFALFNLCYENQETFNNIDEMRAWLTMRAGWYKRVPTPTGEMFQPKSISFSSMDETEFSEYYNRVMDVICLWLDTDQETIAEQLVNFM
jgi:hypothetical protein